MTVSLRVPAFFPVQRLHVFRFEYPYYGHVGHYVFSDHRTVLPEFRKSVAMQAVEFVLTEYR